MTTSALIIALFAAGIRLATPITYAALGGLFQKEAELRTSALKGTWFSARLEATSSPV